MLSIVNLPVPILYVYANIGDIAGDSSMYGQDLNDNLNKLFMITSPIAIPFLWFLCIEQDNDLQPTFVAQDTTFFNKTKS